MNMDPDLIHYACIAKGTLVLAEFNSKDAALGAIAAKCLKNTPLFHATFTHTVRSKTYAFLIEGPIVYFSIFAANLEKAEGLSFLKSVRDAFSQFHKGEKSLERLSSHCYQGEFNPVFRRLLGSGLDHLGEGIGSPIGHRMGESGILQCEPSPVMENRWRNGEKGLVKMKNRLLGDFNFGKRNDEKKEMGGNGVKGIALMREFSVVMHRDAGFNSSELSRHQKAKKVWKRQVWIVLFFDLVICLILFFIWLWVCGGFKCMDA